jgi:2-amino-4-hydroxy-6-hydroxymethyldihydropteridine diphosphokinase
VTRERRYEALLSLGADIQPERNIPKIVARLAMRFEIIALSPAYVSPAFATDGSVLEGRDPFWNLAVRIRTDLPFRALREACRTVEEVVGRRRLADRFAPRVADIDIVFGDARLTASSQGALPADDLVTAPHVLVPASDVWPDALDPATGRSLAAHVADLDASARGTLRRLGTLEELA